MVQNLTGWWLILEVASQLLLSHGMFIKFENTPQKALPIVVFHLYLMQRIQINAKIWNQIFFFFLRVETDKAGWAELGGLFNW